jgi:hypothetical protein
MASNFKISVHRNSENQHLKLSGDFDGSSAWQLLNMLKKISNNYRRVIVHTNSLTNIYAFGLNTFHQNFRNLNVNQIRLLFTGEHAKKISPEKKLCL